MKKPLLFLLFVCLTSAMCAQTDAVKYRVVTFMPNERFYLNGGTRALFGGKSRTYLQVSLPPNTIEWYYAITTTPNEQQNPSINLASQLMKLIDPTKGLAATAVSSLMIPTGAGACDVYLVPDQMSALKFNDKQYERPPYIISGTRENFIQGVVPIQDRVQGNYFLSFRNPSASVGIYVNVEVVAIVANNTNERTQEPSKAELYGSLGWKAYQDGDFDKCLELSKKALELDGSLGWVQCNIALICLVTNRQGTMDEYIKAVELVKKNARAKDYFAAAIKDIDDAKTKMGYIKDADIIRSLLMDEYRRFSVTNR